MQTESEVSTLPTATAAPVPTDDASKTPTASASESGFLVYETFDSGPGAFTTGKRERAKVSISDGRLELYSEGDRALSTADITPTDGLTMSVELLIGPSRESLDAGTQDIVGFTCISGAKGYFLFADNAGQIYLTKLDGPRFKQVGDNYKPKFEMKTGDKIQLTASCIHDGSTTALSLFADGEELVSAVDTKRPLGAFNVVGVTAQQDENNGDTAFVTYLFDNFIAAPVE